MNRPQNSEENPQGFLPLIFMLSHASEVEKGIVVTAIHGSFLGKSLKSALLETKLF
jgi:hypothetical protein